MLPSRDACQLKKKKSENSAQKPLIKKEREGGGTSPKSADRKTEGTHGGLTSGYYGPRDAGRTSETTDNTTHTKYAEQVKRQPAGSTDESARRGRGRRRRRRVHKPDGAKTLLPLEHRCPELVCVCVCCECVSLSAVSSPSLSLPLPPSPSLSFSLSAVEIVLMFPLPPFFCRLLAGSMIPERRGAAAAAAH